MVNFLWHNSLSSSLKVKMSYSIVASGEVGHWMPWSLEDIKGDGKIVWFYWLLFKTWQREVFKNWGCMIYTLYFLHQSQVLWHLDQSTPLSSLYFQQYNEYYHEIHGHICDSMHICTYVQLILNNYVLTVLHPWHMKMSILPYIFSYNTEVFPLQNNPKTLDLSCKMYVDTRWIWSFGIVRMRRNFLIGELRINILGVLYGKRNPHFTAE